MTWTAHHVLNWGTKYIEKDVAKFVRAHEEFELLSGELQALIDRLAERMAENELESSESVPGKEEDDNKKSKTREWEVIDVFNGFKEFVDNDKVDSLRKRQDAEFALKAFREITERFAAIKAANEGSSDTSSVASQPEPSAKDEDAADGEHWAVLEEFSEEELDGSDAEKPGDTTAQAEAL